MTGIRVFIVCVTLSFVTAAYGEDVVVRGWSHENFGRLVFDWPTPVTYTARVTGQQLTVDFDKPIETRFAPALKHLRSYINNASITRDKYQVRFALAGDFSLKSFKNDNAIVLDLRRRQTPQTAQPSLGVRFIKHPTYTRLVFDWGCIVGYSVALEGERLQLRFDKPASVQLASINRELPPGFRIAKASNGKTGLEFDVTVSGKPNLQHYRSGTKVIIDLLVADDRAMQPQIPPMAAPKRATATDANKDTNLASACDTIENVKHQEASDGNKRLLPISSQTTAASEQVAAAPIEYEPKGKLTQINPHELSTADTSQLLAVKSEVRSSGAAPTLLSLVFEWPEVVGAAVFLRAGFVWVAFDKPAPIDLAPLRQTSKGLISRIEQLPMRNATLLRIVPTADVRTYARREGTNWIVEFKSSRVYPDNQIDIDVDLNAEEGARVFFPAAETGGLIRLTDTEVGDLIQVATIKASSHGIQGHRTYPEFQILESAQGLAIVGLNDDVELAKGDGRLVLTAPGGLHISGISPSSSVRSANQSVPTSTPEAALEPAVLPGPVGTSTKKLSN